MSWREELRPASFRGVPFLIEGSDQKLGRRAVQTEYPGRDEPFPEDLGRRAWADSLTAFVIGEDHFQQAQRLAEALNQFGPGELVHPYLGTRLVQVGEVSLSHSSRRGGESVFTIELMEAGPAQAPAIQTNTDMALQQSCDAAERSLLEEFMQRFSVDQLPQGLVDELATAYDHALETVAPLQDMWGQGQALWAQGQGYWDRGASWLDQGQSWVQRVASIAAGFQNPMALGGGLFYGLRQLFGVFGRVGQGEAKTLAAAPATVNTPSPQPLLEALRTLSRIETTRIRPVHMTGSRIEQQKMQAALLDLVHSATVIAAAQASSLVAYRDRQQAGQAQSAFLEAIEQAQQRASDAVYRELAQVRVDLVKDLGSRGAGLPSVTRIVPEQTQPSLVLAYRLYGDSRRESELIERNRPQHPAFIPAGEALEVVR